MSFPYPSRPCLRAVVASGLLAACGRAPAPPPGPGAPALAHAAVAVDARYVLADTVDMELSAQGERLAAHAATRALLEVSSTPRGDASELSVRVRDFAGRLTQPAGRALEADESAILGPLRFTMDRRGRVTDVRPPEMLSPVDQFFLPLDLAHSLFPRLPGRGVAAGASWTDTIAWEGRMSGTRSSSTSIVTYALDGDTTVAGRGLLRIGGTGTVRRSVSGTLAGNAYARVVRGTVRVRYLWDPARSVLVESVEETDATGTMEISVAPVPLDLRLRAVKRVRLAPGG